MTENDVQRIADAVSKEVKANHCLHGITEEEAQHLRNFAQFWGNAKTTAQRSVVGFLVLLILTAIGAGLIELIRNKL